MAGLVLSAVLGCGVGYFWGRSSVPQGTVSAAQAERSAREGLPDLRGRAKATVSNDRRGETAEAGAEDAAAIEEFLAALDGIRKAGGSGSRYGMFEVALLASRLPDGSVEAALRRHFEGKSDNDAWALAAIALTQRLAEIDPEAALRVHREQVEAGDGLDSDQTTTMIVHLWTKQDPAKALAYVHSLIETRRAAGAESKFESQQRPADLFAAVASAMAMHDPGNAWREALRFPRDSAEKALAAVVPFLRDTGSHQLALEEWARSGLPANTAARDLTRQWIEAAGVDAVRSRLESLPDSPARQQAVVGTATHWLRLEPGPAAMDWLARPENQVPPVEIGKVVALWAQSDFDGAGAWLAPKVAAGGREWDSSAAYYAQGVLPAGGSVEDMLAWVQAIEDPELRRMNLSGNLTTAVQRGIPGALEALHASGLPEAVIRQIESRAGGSRE